MLLQLLPQFFSLQHLSVNLSLAPVGTILPVNQLYSEFPTGAAPSDGSTRWESQIFPQISSQAHYPTRTDIGMHLRSYKEH